ncbi:hypothetical protein O3G_MSEX008044 [Manduca sexta]|uniref:Structural maintenance of chromosomes protein 2 n=1 Tax=Manduca sexta TaxID=7130 RepID=A0A922CP90_MANSE|nr:hypothetical protein O3G_MSEX008044 [Manduca sexta]
MYIKSIVLDGFKSYGNRVEITGFDPEFNAITGLNGTGKSNILDSICFVLGITNLSNVRAGSLQELIYKHGQAGITKATVSITFDNRDKRQCPIGYENHDEITVTRQVVMGGKNKYLINGINVQNKRVSDLFCSVQLNVNNPHFLIMQGRITKVLNMKPPEILSMVEEAAGTRMYEAKKQAAQKTIEKKDAKLRELNDIIREDIAPKLQKLQDERSQFQEYQKVVRELENLTRLDVAWRYVTAENNTKEAEQKVTEVQDDIKSKQEKIKDNEKQAKEYDKQVADMNRKLDEVSSTFETLRTASESSKAALNEAQQKFLAVSGLEGASDSLRGQLIAAKQEASEASTRISQRMMEKKHAEERLHALEKEFKSSSAQYQRDQDAIGKQQAQVDQLKAELSRTSYSAQRHRELTDSVRAQHGAARTKRDALDRLAAKLQRCHFNYTPPQPDFDSRRVEGTISRLIDVCDPMYCTALETAAGGKLYNVVVDTDVTSKLLLQRGNLQTRTTIVPLNKISGHVIDPETVRIAQEIGGGPDNVQLALNLVSFPARVRPAMAWAFGSTLVCRDLSVARRVTFDPRVRRRSVTLDGDVVDPAGTLSGGASIKGGSVLLQLQELKQLEQELKVAEQQLMQSTTELNSIQQMAEKYTSMQQRFETMSHELEVVKARLATTTHAQLHAEIEGLRTQVSELSAAVQRDRAAQRDTAARATDLEHKVNDIKGHREREFKKAEENLKKAKKEAEQHHNEWKQREQEFETLQLEVRELQNAVTTSEQQLQELNDGTQALQQALDEAKEEHSKATNEVKQMQQRIKQQKTDIASRNSDIARLIAKKEQLFKSNAELELKIKELDYKIKELQTEATECEDRYQDVMRKKKIVEADRAKLVQVMAELDEKKKKTLVTACEQVNRDFGSIFSTLLPGAQARLTPPHGLTVLDGLEVKVGFNGSWKESLGELSGGQRSLVALALVLALLLFKPAPLYILDEVDAALDLSHTQNIGHMLKEHFTHSQFIIVSLKDGMFNNANVLFRTRFVDGMSSVQRTVSARP